MPVCRPGRAAEEHQRRSNLHANVWKSTLCTHPQHQQWKTQSSFLLPSRPSRIDSSVNKLASLIKPGLLLQMCNGRLTCRTTSATRSLAWWPKKYKKSSSARPKVAGHIVLIPRLSHLPTCRNSPPAFRRHPDPKWLTVANVRPSGNQTAFSPPQRKSTAVTNWSHRVMDIRVRFKSTVGRHPPGCCDVYSSHRSDYVIPVREQRGGGE